jgi:pimeloyl-ACP methyl ester carboxylesterase
VPVKRRSAVVSTEIFTLTQSLPIRQFLLTNLVKDQDTTQYKIRLPLDVISDSIDDIGDFPYAPEDGVRFEKPTLFIKGAESKYINRKNIPVAEQMFPNMRLETIAGAGHWGKSTVKCFMTRFWLILPI